MSKNFDETILLQSEKKRVDTRDERETTRDCRGVGVALPVWPAHQPRRSPGKSSVQGPIVAR